MIALSVLLLVVGALWLVGSLIGLIFKLTFALIGGLFSMVAVVLGLVFGGVALLLAVPLVALALLPICLPVLLLVAVVWAIARSVRRHEPVLTSTPTSR